MMSVVSRRWVQQWGAVLFVAGLIIGWRSTALGYENPIRIITGDTGQVQTRAEVLILLDSSKSQNTAGDTSTTSGMGCTGHQPSSFDICGDGMCSGYEDRSSCSSECIRDNLSDAGYKAVCGGGGGSQAIGSRFFMLKRVMRNVLPDFKGKATFGLVTFSDNTPANSIIPSGGSDYNYYVYDKKDASSSKAVTFLLSMYELQHGGWVGGSGWDTASNTPALSFTKNGVTYQRLDQANLSVAATHSHISSGLDSLYRRQTTTGYIDKRFSWAGLQFSDGTYNWEYQGSFYTYVQWGTVSGGTNSTSRTDYMGPQFVDGANTWVYRRFDSGSNQWDARTDRARQMLNLNPSEDQDAQDIHFGYLMNRFNWPSEGGVATPSTTQNTPMRKAFEQAEAHFEARINGTTPFQTWGPDTLGTCRNRVVILLTDGKVNPNSDDPSDAIIDVYNVSSTSPIKTYVIGSWPQNNKESFIDSLADAGDNGVQDNSASAIMGVTEDEITTALRDTLIEALKGDFTTAAAGVTTILTESGAQVNDNVVLLPSTEYPGWKGHLRALDLRTNPPDEIWEAGQQLTDRSWQSRVMYTGYPGTHESTPNAPVLLMKTDGSGTVNVDGTGFTGGAGIKDVWPGTPPSDSEIIGFVRWMAGYNQDWKLGPIIRSVPATVGAPPVYDSLTDHDVFESDYAGREKMTYVYAADGMLHAFHTLSGEEAFAYLPPEAIDIMYRLYQVGGQSPDPEDFVITTTTSVRVQDIPYYDSGTGKLEWATQMILPMGPAGEAFTVLDVTSPTDCSSCPLNDPPFLITAHSSDLEGTSMDDYLGETWSVPTIYFDWAGNGGSDLAARFSMGAGYAGTESNDNEWYTYLPDLIPYPPASGPWYGTTMENDSLPEGNAQVDFGVTAATSAVADFEGIFKRQVKAVYQADLGGRITRYEKGDPSQGTVSLVDTDGYHPFYFAPAVFFIDDTTGTSVGAVSGSFYEENDYVADAATSGFVSRVFFFQDQGGLVCNPLNATSTTGCISPSPTDDPDIYSCRVDQLCNCLEDSIDDGSTVACANVLSERAIPTSEPLMLQNVDRSNAMELFLVFYEPPTDTSVCGAQVGDTYVVHIRQDPITGTFRLADPIQPYEDTISGGLTIVARGEDISVALSGVGEGGVASASTFTGTVVGDDALEGDVVCEGIREVR